MDYKTLSVKTFIEDMNGKEIMTWKDRKSVV